MSLQVEVEWKWDWEKSSIPGMTLECSENELTSEDRLDQEKTRDEFTKEPRKMLVKDFQLQDKFPFPF